MDIKYKLKKWVIFFVLILFLNFQRETIGLNPPSPGFHPSSPNKNKLLILKGDSAPHGMFAVFLIVVGALDLYEKHQYGGIWIKLDKGFYLDPSMGPNWWEYYFEPLVVLKSSNAIPHPISPEFGDKIGLQTLFYMSRQRGYELIKKYIRVKKNLLDEIHQFKELNFSNSFVIGVHYRGTDKRVEVERLPYESMLAAIKEVIETKVPLNKKDNYCLFVATDEKAFLDYIKQNVSCPVIYTNALRSINNKPIHSPFNFYSNYLKGKEALFDCLLLSRCNYLIRTESNLSESAGFFNPALPIKVLKTKWKIGSQ